MKKNQREIKEKSPIITEPGTTPNVLSSRGGLTLFVRYIRAIGPWPSFGVAFRYDDEEQKRPAGC